MEKRPYLKSISLKRDKINDFSSYPFTVPAIRELDVLEFHSDVTFLVGENGSGKSTIIEAIALAMGFSPEGGTRNFQLSSANDMSSLHQSLRLVRNFSKPKDGYFLRAESFYNVATYMEEVGYLEGYGGKSLHARSHGEAFMATLLHKLRGNGLYILDEPEAALSPARQMSALKVIHDLVQEESQFIIATHSPILMAYPNARIFLLDGAGITQVKYEDTEHYGITRSFLNNHQGMIRHLLADEE